MPPTIFPSQEPAATARMSPRHRPLHACGVSILAIADVVFGKTQDVKGPLGSALRRITKLAKFAAPLVYAVLCQWLAILSFADDHILAAENIVERWFPPSRRAFDKIDELVVTISSLPETFDVAVNEFPAMVHRVPLVEWALIHLTSRLSSLVSALNRWGLECSRTNEKTIGVDGSCNVEEEESDAPVDSSKKIDGENLESFPPVSEASSEGENKGVVEVAVPSSHKMGSYKEALERGNKEEKPQKEEVDEGECDEVNEGEKNGGNDEEDESLVVKSQVGSSESVVKEVDPLLELFESGWLMSPGRHGNRREHD